MSDVDLVTEFEAFGYSIKADLVNKGKREANRIGVVKSPL